MVLPAASQPSTAAAGRRGVAEHDNCGRHTDDLGAGADLDPHVSDSVPQQVVEVGLVEQVGFGVPVDTATRIAAERRERPQPRVEQPQLGGGPADPGEAVGDPGELEHSHALAVEVHRTGSGPGSGWRSSTTVSTL